MAELLPAGTAVRLERDVEARDRYGRLLAYVIRADDELFVNLALVAEGFAESNQYRPNTARQAELDAAEDEARAQGRSEEHTSELQSLMRISYAVFCLKKKTNN